MVLTFFYNWSTWLGDALFINWKHKSAIQIFIQNLRKCNSWKLIKAWVEMVAIFTNILKSNAKNKRVVFIRYCLNSAISNNIPQVLPARAIPSLHSSARVRGVCNRSSLLRIYCSGTRGRRSQPRAETKKLPLTDTRNIAACTRPYTSSSAALWASQFYYTTYYCASVLKPLLARHIKGPFRICAWTISLHFYYYPCTLRYLIAFLSFMFSSKYTRAYDLWNYPCKNIVLL